MVVHRPREVDSLDLGFDSSVAVGDVFSTMRRALVRVSIATSVGLFATTASAQPALPQGDAPSEGAASGDSTPTTTSASTTATVEASASAQPPEDEAPLDEEPELEDPDEVEGDAEEAEPDRDAPGTVDGRREGLMPINGGSIGHFYTTLPDVGERFSVRFRVHTDFFVRNRFMYALASGEADRHARVRGGVSLGFSPFRWGEVFFSVRSVSNHNSRPVLDPAGDVQRVDQSYFVVGDVDFGVKAAHRFKNGIAVGGLAGLGVLPGSRRLRAQTVDFWIDALFSIDLRYLTAKQFPFRFTANVGWYLDNSLTTAAYGRTRDPITREIARFSLEGNHNRVRMRYAVDFPVRLGKNRRYGLDPILEWSWDISHVNESEAFAWPEIPPAHRAVRSTQWLTAGLRANVISGLHLDAAIDVGLLSPDHEWGPRTPPWQLILGLGWAFDPAAPPKKVEVPAPTPSTATLEGRIVGRVLDPQGTPVADATLRFPGLTPGGVITDAAGSFVSYRFPEGNVTLQVFYGGQFLQEVTAAVEDGEDTELTITLDQMPVTPTGILRGQFTDAAGQPVAVRMYVVGQGVDEGFDADASGQIALELFEGSYRATLSAPGFRDKSIDFTVTADGEVALRETLERAEAPETPLVSGSGRALRLRRAIQYKGDEVAPASHEVLDQLALFLQFHSEIELVRVGVHTDDTGNPKTRSEARAAAVRDYLVARGVAASRLEAKGYGDTRPVAVNLTSAGRAKNNRTVFSVVRGSITPTEAGASPAPAAEADVAPEPEPAPAGRSDDALPPGE